MKKLLFSLILLVCATACKNEVHLKTYGNMIYFVQYPYPDGWVEPVTEISANPLAQVELLVQRNVFAAHDHPKQTAKVVVAEGPGLAKLGTDFSLSAQTFNFPDKSTTGLPLQVHILDNTSGKKIILKLAYDYYNECPEEGRTADELVITVE